MKSAPLLLFMLLVSAVTTFAANKDMPTSGLTGVTAACSGDVFRDNGGSFSYSSNVNSIYTICPSAAGNRLRFTFTTFNLELNDDILYVYDGSSTADPLIGAYTGTTSPGVITASSAGGCITFRFISDNNTNNAGWLADITCIAACQSITANFISSSPAPNGSGVILACQNASINFVGSGTFGSGSGAGATYTWDFGDGTTATGTSVNHSYTTGGAYTVNLTITDAAGCKNANFINRIVQVSTTPTITTSATPTPLCTNQISHLNANVTMNTNTSTCAVPVAGTTYLPDINGGYYFTSIPVSCYTPGAIVTAATNIVSICMSLEHTFLGDLNILLRCPDGKSMVLKSYPFGAGSGGGGDHLGIPVETDGTGPGTGWNYCFTPAAGTYLVDGTTTNIGGFNYSIVAGNYKPSQPFTNLIGCPLNGNWTVEISDHLPSDDGYIFNWSINFDPALLPASQTFTPTIVSQGWTVTADMYNNTATACDVVPTSTGTKTYTYSVTDNFGCTYTQTQNVVVNCTSLPVGLVSFDAKALSDRRVELSWITETEENTNRFEIDRSADGENWEFVTAAEAAGDSQEELVYSSFDAEALMGVSYYRLRSIDNDGTQQVSDIDVVTINPEEGMLVIYPNPATDWLTIEGNDDDLAALQLINPLGQNVISQVNRNTEVAARLQLDLSPLAKGTYMVRTATKSYLIVKN